MEKRICILGAGRFGTHLATRLCEYGCEVLIADRDPARVKDLAEDGYHAVEMSADDEDALREIGVAEADAVVVAIGENMQASMLATLLLKELGVKRIIARAVDSKHGQILEKVGADLVVLPTRDMAYRLADRLRDDAGGDRQLLGGDYQLAHIRFGPDVKGRSLVELGWRDRYRVNVVLVIRPVAGMLEGGPVRHLEPEPGLRLAPDDLCLVVGERDNLNRFERECGVRA